MTKTTFKEKLMKKRSLVIKEASNREHQTQGRSNHTHNPPNNFPQYQTCQKGGCTQLFKEQLRMYATFGQKSAYIIFHVFLGMIKETSKDKKWSIGAKESAVGQGKAIQSVIHLER